MGFFKFVFSKNVECPRGDHVITRIQVIFSLWFLFRLPFLFLFLLLFLSFFLFLFFQKNNKKPTTEPSQHTTLKPKQKKKSIKKTNRSWSFRIQPTGVGSTYFPFQK